ncbi:MAG: hypothetical protein K2J08_00190 [Ruminococcus sp.]|nr:hypothetical protein [Ruminococcus sp.]
MYNNKNLCFADFEFTCGYKINKLKSEILSVGIVICDSRYIIKEKFYCTCRPHLFPTLTRQCMKLTHLRQREIDNSPDSNDVMRSVNSLLKKYDIDFVFVWGNFDRHGFISDIQQHTRFKKECGNIRKVSKMIVDIQADMTEKMNLPEAVNIKELASAFDFQPVSGTFHNAINDALALYVIHKAVNTENVMENEKLSAIRRERIEKREQNQLKSEKKRTEIAFSVPLSESEKIYYEEIKGNARKEIDFIILRSKIISVMQNNPSDSEFIIVHFRENGAVKAIPKRKYNYTLQRLSEKSVEFNRENFSVIILEECKEKETVKL